MSRHPDNQNAIEIIPQSTRLITPSPPCQHPSTFSSPPRLSLSRLTAFVGAIRLPSLLLLNAADEKEHGKVSSDGGFIDGGMGKQQSLRQSFGRIDPHLPTSSTSSLSTTVRFSATSSASHSAAETL